MFFLISEPVKVSVVFFYIDRGVNILVSKKSNVVELKPSSITVLIDFFIGVTKSRDSMIEAFINAGSSTMSVSALEELSQQERSLEEGQVLKVPTSYLGQ